MWQACAARPVAGQPRAIPRHPVLDWAAVRTDTPEGWVSLPAPAVASTLAHYVTTVRPHGFPVQSRLTPFVWHGESSSDVLVLSGISEEVPPRITIGAPSGREGAATSRRMNTAVPAHRLRPLGPRTGNRAGERLRQSRGPALNTDTGQTCEDVPATIPS